MRVLLISTLFALSALSASAETPGIPPKPESTGVSPEVHEQLIQWTHRQLDAVQRASRHEMEIAPGTTDHIVALNQGEDDQIRVDVARRFHYTFLGVCDTDCTDVDLELLDTDGNVVASDRLPDDFPVVNANFADGGPLTVRLILVRCRVEPCYVGLRVLRRPF